MKACAREVFGSDSLQDRTVAIQGVGKVGSHLAGHLREEGAKIVAADLNEEATKRAKQEFGATLVKPDEIYDVECDILSPCALGGVLNDKTIPRLKCQIVAGGANNQLAEDKHGDQLRQKGILYAPDYIINAGGVINISVELTGYSAEQAKAQTAEIYHTMQRVIALAKAEQISTAKIADRIAQENIEQVRKSKRIYLKR